MTTREKLIQRILARPPEASFSDVRELLEDFGWMLARERGSHAHFVKAGETVLTISRVRGRRVRRIYLSVVIERLGLEDRDGD